MYLKLIMYSMICALASIYLHPLLYETLTYLFTTNQTTHTKPTKLFTNAQLKLHNGIDNSELYLAILGKVYDVTKGANHYGPGSSYNTFVGRDSSRSFITGKFNPDEASDEVADLSPEDLRSLDGWVKFYNKNYPRIGKLIGRYYDEDGKLTRYGQEVRKLMKGAYQLQDADHLQKLKYPPCNVEWSASTGSRVWCSDRSGGITRKWVGFPRQLYEAGSKEYRCACVESATEAVPNMKPYIGCDNSHSCFVNE